MKKLSIVSILTIALCIVPFLNSSNTAMASDELPSWIKNTKIKGDVRFRFQTEDRDSQIGVIEDGEGGFDKEYEKIDRNRWRLRWRFGMESKPNDQWKVGFGLASGSDDARSTNQTLQNFFDTPGAQLDYAYAKWMPTENMELTVGKFKNPIWNPKDLLWDGDIMPEGIAASANFKASDNINIFITPAFFVLDEFKDHDFSFEDADEDGEVDEGEEELGVENPEDDPNMIALQAGTKINFSDDISTKFGVTYYKFNNIEEIDEDDSAWSLEADAGFTALPIFIGVFGQYVFSAADDNNTGYLFGVKFGDKKVKKLGDWQAKYNYRKLEMVAWPDVFPDSDFMGGDTGVEGSEIEVKVGLYKNVTLGIDYYMAEEIDSDDDQNLLQLDLVVKFP